MIQEELNERIRLHSLWLKDEPNGIRLDLTGVDFGLANLSGADLRWADLGLANLSGADLSGADLRWADLRWADLTRVDLTGVDLTGVVLPSEIPAIPNLEKLVAERALQPGCLEMKAWHTCETTHCIAGWACHIANKPYLEAKYSTKTFAALLFAASGEERVPNFYLSNTEATELLKSWL